MTRRFSAEPVDAPLLATVLGVVTAAPTAGFTQGVELLALLRPERRQTFWSLASAPEWRDRAPEAPGLLAAPVVVLPLGDPTAYESRYAAPDKASSSLGGKAAAEWPDPYWLVDSSFAAMLVLLAAEDAGLGALFFQLHGDRATLLAGLGLPPGRVTIGAIAIGYPEASPAAPRRRARAPRPGHQLVHLDDYP